MKSYILSPVPQAVGREVLNALLPGQTDPWVIWASRGGALAYFNVMESEDVEGEWWVQADISGRHYNRDADVIALLEEVRKVTGGEIIYSP